MAHAVYANDIYMLGLRLGLGLWSVDSQTEVVIVREKYARWNV